MLPIFAFSPRCPPWAFRHFSIRSPWYTGYCEISKSAIGLSDWEDYILTPAKASTASYGEHWMNWLGRR